MSIQTMMAGAKKKVVDVASDMMTAPQRMAMEANKRNVDTTIAARQMVRSAKGTPDSGDYTDPLFRARSRVFDSNYEAEYAKKRAEAANPTAQSGLLMEKTMVTKRKTK